MIREKLIGHVLLFSRLLVGGVFIFSGFVKGIDPLGTVYKINDYLLTIGLSLADWQSLVLSFSLNALEFIVGFALLANIFTRFFTWVAVLFMAFYTPLTLLLAIYNPVTDCGCFGDAIILSNWATFFKNLLISAFIAFLFFYRKSLFSPHSKRRQAVLISVTSLAFLALTQTCYENLPLIDFRPYKKGAYLPDGMIVPEAAPKDSFQTVLVYQKDDLIKNFTPENVPWQDTTWKWVETRSELIRQGYHPPIHDFSFTDRNGFDVTEKILKDSLFVFLAVSNDIRKADTEDLVGLIPVYEFCERNHFTFYLATSSNETVILEAKRSLDLPYEFCTADEIMLKTVIRSNPGLVLLKNGTVLNKWSAKNIPEFQEKSLYAGIVGDYRRKTEAALTALFFTALGAISVIILKLNRHPQRDEIANRNLWFTHTAKEMRGGDFRRSRSAVDQEYV